MTSSPFGRARQVVESCEQHPHDLRRSASTICCVRDSRALVLANETELVAAMCRAALTEMEKP